MEIILIQDVDKLGKAGDLLKVSAGYGRNYLLPKKFAILATNSSKKRLSEIKNTANNLKLEADTALKNMALQLGETELVFTRKADESGHLFGSVSDVDITKSLIESDFNVHKSMIKGEKHLKTLGEHIVNIALSGKISADIKVIIKNEE